MWFLGAGASRAAGIKAAEDMVWEFKRNLYCSEKKQPLSAVSDLADPSVRQNSKPISTVRARFHQKTRRMNTPPILRLPIHLRKTEEPTSSMRSKKANLRSGILRSRFS